MSEPFKLYVREKFTTRGIGPSGVQITCTSQVIAFENRVNADFAANELEEAGVFVVKLYP